MGARRRKSRRAHPKKLQVLVREYIAVRERLSMADGRRRKGKPKSWIDARDDIYRDTGCATWTERCFDRVNDLYGEKIIDKATGGHIPTISQESTASSPNTSSPGARYYVTLPIGRCAEEALAYGLLHEVSESLIPNGVELVQIQ
jgi:hypothetical protein